MPFETRLTPLLRARENGARAGESNYTAGLSAHDLMLRSGVSRVSKHKAAS